MIEKLEKDTLMFKPIHKGCEDFYHKINELIDFANSSPENSLDPTIAYQERCKLKDEINYLKEENEKLKFKIKNLNELRKMENELHAMKRAAELNIRRP